jgi:histidine triad (HIT) family protein
MTIFTKIVMGEIPCYKIAEDEKFLAFLDVSPLAKGHVLVIPKTEIDYIFDLNDADFSEMFLFAKKVSKGIKAAMPCVKVGISVIGLEVPHAHIHLIPMNSVSDMNFSKAKLTLGKDEMEEIAKHIISSL